MKCCFVFLRVVGVTETLFAGFQFMNCMKVWSSVELTESTHTHSSLNKRLNKYSHLIFDPSCSENKELLLLKAAKTDTVRADHWPLDCQSLSPPPPKKEISYKQSWDTRGWPPASLTHPPKLSALKMQVLNMTNLLSFPSICISSRVYGKCSFNMKLLANNRVNQPSVCLQQPHLCKTVNLTTVCFNYNMQKF